ncbi:Heterokaryon incompatibility 6-like protein [Cladobotryum mycophilum]|uniref:Heterokaryon incompatibility 6-like protein n=1 Tax=Cladobotryum mycophilum TaxID=491253 RepID=A0ABR0SHX8_9HYPO
MPNPEQHTVDGWPASDDVEHANNNNTRARSNARLAESRFPQSRQEAINHIEEIRQSQKPRLEDVEFQGMLKELSDGQNSNVFRVLYELLQNADDSRYDARTPKVNIRFHDRLLLFESNEVGFSKDNVNSICHMAMGSKKGTQDADGHRLIGEKGIGFKTVFMIATSVWVTSGYYSFRFDRNGPLGRIRPIWDEDPPGESMASEGFTSILLKLPDSTERPEDMSMISSEEVVRGMRELDSMDLLFLSRVKHVEIGVNDGGAWMSRIFGSSSWQRTLRADKISGEPRILTSTKVYRDKVAEPHVVFRYPVSQLPRTSERLDRTTSEIVLVFPQGLSRSSSIPTTKLYAYLPVRNYGFKFVVHSDFVLVSNREDMKPIAWNKALVSRIPYALVEAIMHFRDQHLSLWFDWPLLLPLGELESDIFRDLPAQIIKICSKKSILEDVHGNLLRPRQLRILPPSLKGADGLPLLPTSHSRHNLISDGYPVAATDILEHLGVQMLSFESFLVDLEVFISECSSEFANKPDSWHNQVCELLLQNFWRNPDRILRLALFPLADPPERGHQWVPSNFGSLYFSNGILKLPKGITGAYRIHAKDGTANTLCELIIAQHEEEMFNKTFHSLTTDDMVSHLLFLYKGGWQRQRLFIPNLWCACEDGEKRQMSEMYIPTSKMYSAKFISQNSGLMLHFLDPLYMRSFQNLPRGYEWLMESVGFVSWLRVIEWTEDIPSLHPDFVATLTNNPMMALNALRHNWSFYSTFFKDSAQSHQVLVEGQHTAQVLSSSDREKLRHQVSDTMVPCHSASGTKVVRMLWETYLPRESMLMLCATGSVARCDCPPESCRICQSTGQSVELGARGDFGPIVEPDRFLCISDPQDSSWDFLEIFGVFVNPRAQLFVDYLRRIRGTHIEHNVAQKLYAHLEKFALGEAKDMVTKCLMESDSIYIPHRLGISQGRWMSYDAVVWDGPRSLRHVPRLADFYETRSQLFRVILQIPNAGLAALQIEASHLEPDDIGHVQSVLQQISAYLGTQSADTKPVPDFSKCRMFPEAFLGQIDLTVFSDDEFRSMKELCIHFNLDSRIISGLLVGTSADPTVIYEHKSYAKMLQAKASYLASLIPLELGPEAHDLKLKQLQTIRVFKSSQILIRWNLKVGENIIHSNAVESRVTSEMRDEMLTLYVVADDDLLISGYCPIELSHLLSNFCGISNNQDSRLVTQILAQSNHKLIMADIDSHLEERGRKSRDTTWSHRMPVKAPKVRKEMEYAAENETTGGLNGAPELQLNSRRLNSVANWSRSVSSVTGQDADLRAQLELGRGDTIEHIWPQRALQKLNRLTPASQAISATETITPYEPLSLLSAGSSGDVEDRSDCPDTLIASEQDDLDYEVYQGNSVWSAMKNGAATLFDDFEASHSPRYCASEATDGSSPTISQEEGFEQTRFYGELYVSRLLDSILGSDIYRPDEHWTSSMRSRSGHRPFEDMAEHGDCSTFKITETRGKLRKAVIDRYQIPAESLHEVCTFHIQVCTTVEGLESPFAMSSVQYKKAKAMTLSTNTCASNIYILARVYNVQTDPGIALYADPWRLHQQGLISLEPASSYLGNVSLAASAMQIDQCSNDIASEPEQLYQNLKVNMGQIRLLRLELNKDLHAPLKGELVIKSIDSNSSPASFWAISYARGPKPTKLSPFKFVLNGVEIPITESLWTCFRRLRSDGVTVLLWADGLCINQKDRVEKNMQVRLMGSIYQIAERVIIWMGSNMNEDSGAIQSLHKYRTRLGSRYGKSSPTRSMGVDELDGEHISEFLQHSWFTRTRAIQEVAFGSQATIMHGESNIEWDDFMNGLLAFEEHAQHRQNRYERHSLRSYHYSDPAYALNRTRQALRGVSEDSSQGRSKLRFLTLVDMFFYTKTSKPRDRLFALLNLASDTSINDGPFLPDYESDDEDILARYAAEFVRRGQVFELLYRAGTSKGSWFKSWIPDLMNHGNKSHYAPTISTWKAMGTRQKAGFSAGASLSPRAVVMYPETFPTLAITGRMFDTIESSLPIQLGPTGSGNNFGNIMKILRQYVTHSSFYTGHGKHLQDDVLYRMLIGDAEFSQEGGLTEKQLVVLAEEFNATSPSQDAQNSQTQPIEIRHQIDTYWQMVAKFLTRVPNAEACLTRKGYAGIVPGGTRPGDCIFVPHGANVPFLLRRVSDTKYFELLGEAYVYGIMYYEHSPVKTFADVEILIT